MTTITVTQDDIDHGKKADCRCCPIARAVRRAWKPECKFVAVTGIKLFVYFKPTSTNWNPHEVYTLPLEAELFVADFDNGKGVEPFEFEVDETKPLI